MTIEITTTAEYLRLSHIKRFGIVKTADTQSVAEHSWRVGLLFIRWAPLVNLTEQEIADGLMYVMLHDIHEVRSGDMPTPTKSPELKALLDSYEDQIAPEVAGLKAKLTPTAAALIKACDIAEAVLYLKVSGLGKHAADVTCLLEQQLLAHRINTGLPEALYAEFTNCYHAT